MKAKKHLVAAYTTWEELTRAEGLAIANAEWARVSECQHSKQGLQKDIIHLTEAAQAECIAAGQDTNVFERDLRGIINTLIALESRNSELLAQRRSAAEVARTELDQVAHNLRRVQKSYSPPTHALWDSYS